MTGRHRRGLITAVRRPTLVMSLVSIVAVVGVVAVVSPGAGAAVASRTGRMVAAPVRTPFPSVSFVVTCGRSHSSTDDPIVHPGHPGASHRHDFFGSVSTAADSDATTLARGSTTCNEAGDKAAYWLPTLRGNGWAPRMRAYYSAGPLAPAAIVAYPTGLQLIAGSGSSHSAPGVDVVAFSCGRAVDEPGWSASPPSCAGSTTVRLSFPQCWDGVRLEAPGNAVAPVGTTCPSTHPIALPLLRLVVSTSGRVSPADFVTSAGGVNRLHADFLNAWDPSTLARLVALCTRGERTSNRDVKQCRTAGTGPRAVGGPATKETNF